MSKIVSTRLNEEEISELNDLAKQEHLDRASLIHKILIDKIIERKMQRMAELYQKGVLSLQEASTAADVSIYEMMEYLEKEKIQPPIESVQEMESNFQYAQKILKNARRQGY